MASPLILSFFFLSFFYWLKRVKQKTNQNWNRRGVYWRRSISWVLNVKHSDVRVLKLLRSKRKLVKCRRKKKKKSTDGSTVFPPLRPLSITPHHPILSLSLSPLKKNVVFQVWKRQEFWNLLSYKKSSSRKKKSFVIVGFSKSTWENPKQKQKPKKKKKTIADHPFRPFYLQYS